MKRLNRMTAAVLALSILLGGCQGKEQETETASEPEKTAEAQGAESSTPEEEGTHIVIDHGGNEVEVPDNVTRVVIDQIPILSTYMAYFNGEAPYIVGFCGSFKDTISKTVLKDIAPELMETADTVYAQSDLNIEEIIKLEPDVILYNAGNEAHAEILKESGIPCVGFATVGADTPADPLIRYQQWLDLLAQVFGDEKKVADFTAAGNKIIADVEARISEIPEEERPSALILWKYNEGVPQVPGQGTFGHFWMKHLSVKDAAAETKGFNQVSIEQIYEWDPDILFLDGPGLLPLKVEDVMENRVEGFDFSQMTAYKTGRVYDTTLGMWNWFTPNPDAPLVFAWLACNTYPEQFADYPLTDTIKEYYSTWYGYELSDEEIAEMLMY